MLVLKPTSMAAQNSVFNGGSQGKPVEKAVQALPRPNAILLPQPFCALQPEAKQSINVRGLHTLRKDYQWLSSCSLQVELLRLMADVQPHIECNALAMCWLDHRMFCVLFADK